METINFNNDEIKKLEKVKFDFENVESDLYLYKTLILKIYKKFKKKEYKIKNKKLDKLGQLDEIEGLIIPKYKIDIDGVFSGCASTYIKDTNNFLDLYEAPLKEIIYLYKEASKIIEKAHNNEIIIGDVNSSNILFKNKRVYFCDIDSCLIDKIPSVVTSSILYYNPNIEEFIPFSKGSDKFLINMLFINKVMNKNMNILYEKEFSEELKKLNLSNGNYLYFKNMYDMDNLDHLSNVLEDPEIETQLKRRK